jgi:hypothetical protein
MDRVTMVLRPAMGSHTRLHLSAELMEPWEPCRLVDLCAALQVLAGPRRVRLVLCAEREWDWLGEWAEAALEASVRWADVEVRCGSRRAAR